MYVSEDKGNDDCTDVCGTLLLSESVHKNVGRTHDSSGRGRGRAVIYGNQRVPAAV